MDNLIHHTRNLQLVATNGCIIILLHALHRRFEIVLIVSLHEDVLLESVYRGSALVVHDQTFFDKTAELFGNLHSFKIRQIEDNLVLVILRQTS